MSSRILALAALLLAAALAACGGEETDREPAVNAREGNLVRMNGLAYRAVLFRELNPRVTPDQALVERPPPGAGRGLYAAFVEVCNESDERRVPTLDIQLEDAFGQAFSPLRSGVDETLAYRPRPLKPGACLPAPGSAADRTFAGAALLFEVPYDSVQERPMILQITPRGGGEPRRVELDL